VELKDPMSGYFLMWRKDFCAIQGDPHVRGFMVLLGILAILRPAMAYCARVTEHSTPVGCGQMTDLESQ
jgi:hypothetical protein